MAEEEKEAAAAPPKPPKKIGALLENKVVMLGIIVIIQALTALAVTQFFIAPKLKATAALAHASLGGAAGAEVPAADAKEGVLAGLDEMIITLRSDAGTPHFLRTNVSLEVTDLKVSKLIEERRPQLRDVAILVLSSRTADELLTPEGKESVKKEILQRLGEHLPSNTLLNVYFADLMIQ